MSKLIYSLSNSFYSLSNYIFLRTFIKRYPYKNTKTSVAMIRYDVKELQDPTNRPVTKFYAKPVYEGTISLSKVEEDISSATTLSRADVRATILALVDEIGDYLLDGYNVKIDELGTFFLRSQSVGKETEKEVRGEDVMKLNVGFKAATEFKQKMKRETKLKKVRR